MNFASVRRIIEIGRPDPPAFAAQQALGVDDIPLGIKGAREKSVRTLAGTMRNGRPELARIERGDRRDALEQLRGDTCVEHDKKKGKKSGGGEKEAAGRGGGG